MNYNASSVLLLDLFQLKFDQLVTIQKSSNQKNSPANMAINEDLTLANLMAKDSLWG